MPPTRARGKFFWGSIVSSATFAAFSKPVIAKKESATPAMIAKMTCCPATLKSVSTVKSASPSAT